MATINSGSYDVIFEAFLEALENQFPVTEEGRSVHWRRPSDFADVLNIHVNHLNRVVKKKTEKTTSQVIIEKFLQESKRLLAESEWEVMKIAASLGFKEATHFSNFFKKHMGISPSTFRKRWVE